MRIAVFGTKPYDRQFLDAANAGFHHDLTYLEPRLEATTAVLAGGFPAVCVFVNDVVDAGVLTQLASGGTRLVALRCAGFNNVDLAAAARLGIAVVRVPAYSPHAVAEFTIGLLLALDRNIARAAARVRENNFALDGLIGRNLHGRVVGVVGTGRIGALVARILKLGFGCRVLASDPVIDPALVAIGVRYVATGALLAAAEIFDAPLPADAGDAAPDRRRRHRRRATAGDDRQHQSRRADRHQSADRRVEAAQDRRGGARRLRTGRRSVLRRLIERDHQ